ncbi:cytochrome C [Flavobacterium hercynium]|uniref:Cytochrome C n=1 Tax=Flavobacterium hercynium TaxID=387094 RepID=A0A226GZ18_9FLAO|nr:cytochrome C [Flavobacterium hercynium]OXA87263.1 hypothetical protein B0A66_16755 [Flavobacterium hercynium]SMP19457.1 Dihaem cytochrome c [Flavobacterium hercynium]
MKLKIIFAAVIVLFAFSCGTPKIVATTPVAPVASTVSSSAAEVKVTELAPELVKGKSLYEKNCAGCHKLFQPKTFTKEEWKPILVKMQKFTNLEDAEMVFVSNYIDSQL